MTGEAFDWENTVLDRDLSINVSRAIDGREVRQWDFRRANIVGQRGIRQTATIEFLKESADMPSQSFDAWHGLED